MFGKLSKDGSVHFKVLSDTVKGTPFYKEDKATYSHYHSGCHEKIPKELEGGERLMLAGLIREGFVRPLYLS